MGRRPAGMPLLRAVFLGLASLTSSCSVSANVRGSVRSAGTAPGEAARPVAGARVTMRCAEHDALALGVTDAKGRFAHDLAQPVSNACWIVTEKDGMLPEKVRVLDACACAYAGRDDQCTEVVVTAHLAPTRAP